MWNIYNISQSGASPVWLGVLTETDESQGSSHPTSTSMLEKTLMWKSGESLGSPQTFWSSHSKILTCGPQLSHLFQIIISSMLPSGNSSICAQALLYRVLCMHYLQASYSSFLLTYLFLCTFKLARYIHWHIHTKTLQFRNMSISIYNMLTLLLLH